MGCLAKSWQRFVAALVLFAGILAFYDSHDDVKKYAHEIVSDRQLRGVGTLS